MSSSHQILWSNKVKIFRKNAFLGGFVSHVQGQPYLSIECKVSNGFK